VPTGTQRFLVSVPADLATAVAAFVAGARAAGYELWDCEFYTQADGRVAVLDFDQCRLV
jgi:hypothetical protein